MLRIRIASAAVIGTIAVVSLSASGAGAQTATAVQPGKPLALLAGLRPPHEPLHETKAIARAGKHGQTVRKQAAKKSSAKIAGKPGKRNHHSFAAMEPPEPAAQPTPAADNAWPIVNAPATAEAAAAPPPQSASAQTDDEPAMSEIVVGGQTVQVDSADQVNEIDLAANDRQDAVPSAAANDGTEAAPAPAARSLLFAPVEEKASPVGSASWIAQVLAALGGALAAGGAAWFMIGSGPVRTSA
jgi:hypothetical protein